MTKPDRSRAPEVRPFGHLELPAMRTVATPHGAQIHVLDDEACPLARVSLTVPGGRCESTSQALATLAPMMLSEGSAGYDTLAVADALDFHGATLTARAHDHHTRVDLTAQPAYMPALIDMLADALVAPAVPEGRLEVLKASLDAQCAYEATRVDAIAGKAAMRLLAGADHPCVRYAAPGDYAAIGAAEVRGRLAELFRAPGLEVFVSGALSPDIMARVEALVEALPPAGGIELCAPPFRPSAPTTEHVAVEGACQCAVNAVLPAVRRDHPDYIPLRLAVTALGGYFGSRLMQNIREDKGYTYGITASLCGQREGSYVEIAAECAPQYAEALLDEVRRELSGMASRPLDADAMLRMRLYEQTRLAAVLDNAIATADHYASAVTVGMPDGYFAEQERITASITPEQLADVSARYLVADNLRVVVAGEK